MNLEFKKEFRFRKILTLNIKLSIGRLKFLILLCYQKNYKLNCLLKQHKKSDKIKRIELEELKVKKCLKFCNQTNSVKLLH